jgi:hypothetical protein
MVSSRSMLRVLLQTSYSGSASLLDISWLADGRVHAPLARICARVDYLNGLQQELEGERATSQEVREEFAALVLHEEITAQFTRDTGRPVWRNLH